MHSDQVRETTKRWTILCLAKQDSNAYTIEVDNGPAVNISQAEPSWTFDSARLGLARKIYVELGAARIQLG